MSKYEVQVPPYATTFIKSITRSSATDEMLLVLRSRCGGELVYAASDAPAIIDGLRQFIEFATVNALTTRNLRERSDYEAAKRGLLAAKTQAEKHLRRSLTNRPS